MNSIKNTPFPSMTPVVGVVVLCLQSITAIEYFRKLVKSSKNIVESATDFIKMGVNTIPKHFACGSEFYL